MRVAFVGKGGSGKSVIAGTVSRELARQAQRVLALDFDTMPGLAYTIGLRDVPDAGLPEDLAVRRKKTGWVEAQGDVVVADFEAGLGTVSRLKPGFVDLVIVVTDPTAKAIDVARRGLAMVQERALATAVVIANRVANDDDRGLIEAAFDGGAGLLVPDEPAIRQADSRGVAPFDAAPDAAGVRLVRGFADRLTDETGRTS